MTLTAKSQEITFSTSATSILEQISTTANDVNVTGGELKEGDTLEDSDLDIANNYAVTYGDNTTLTAGTGTERNNEITIGRDIANTKQILEALPLQDR